MILLKPEGGIIMIRINPFENPDRYTWNALGMRLLFADAFKNLSRYVPEAKSWYVYNGKVWALDVGDLQVQQFAIDLVEHLILCNKLLEVDKKRELWLDILTNNKTGYIRKAGRDTLIKDAASVYPVSILEFDKNPYWLNCQNCTLDLKSMTMKKHNPLHFLSKISNVNFDKDATCERWETFINEVMQDNKNKAKFLQKAFGYSLTGNTSHECFFILHGATTRNGKGTTCETISSMMGNYGKTVQPETLAQKQNASSSGPSEDIARLKGARFVNMSEPDKGLRLSSGLVKQLTGGDTVTARFLHQNSFEYRPEYKVFINCNYKPKINDDTIFASGRVHLIEFNRHFKKNEQDKGLKAFFRQPENLSGILNWCIQGLKALQAEGLQPPDVVEQATKEYREESNPIGQFINDNLQKSDGFNTSLKDVYENYKKWCEDQGLKPFGVRNFANELRKAGIEVCKATDNKTFLIGFSERSNEENPFGY